MRGTRGQPQAAVGRRPQSEPYQRQSPGRVRVFRAFRGQISDPSLRLARLLRGASGLARHDHRERAAAAGDVDGESGCCAGAVTPSIERHVGVLLRPGAQVLAARPAASSDVSRCREPRGAIGGGEAAVGREVAVRADQHSAWPQRGDGCGETARSAPRGRRHVVERQRRDHGVAARQLDVLEAPVDRRERIDPRRVRAAASIASSSSTPMMRAPGIAAAAALRQRAGPDAQIHDNRTRGAAP